MELFEKSAAFHQFLKSLLQQEHRRKVFLDGYEAFVVGAGCTTPFSSFVGQRDRPTVVISKHVAPIPSDSIVMCDLSNMNSSNMMSLVEEQASSNPLMYDLSKLSDSQTSSDPLPIYTQKTIPLEQPLTNNRVYLTHSAPFHKGWSGPNVQSVASSRDEGLTPLPLDSARFLASLYSLGSWKAQGLPDLWVVCERNSRGIVALGCAYDAPKRVLLTFTVEEGGTGSEMDMKSKLDKAETEISTTASAFSEYDIANTSSEEATQTAGEFRIQFAWSDPEAKLSSPPESANGILRVSNTPGDLFSPVLSMYGELKSLHKFCKIASGEAYWTSTDLDQDSEDVLTSGDKMTKDVEGFVQELAHPLTHSADITVMSPPTSDHTVYEPRTDLDFTERLWLFCQGLTSIDHVRLVFAEVFKAVLLRKMQPFIHQKSSSVVASLLRQVLLAPDGAALQDVALKLQHLLLTEERLLHCLIQIGIEKIKRDYRLFFVGTDICSAEQFERFFTAISSSSSSSSSPLAQCLELCKLHSVLELDASIMKVLRLPSTHLLSSFTRAAVEVFVRDQDYQPFAPAPVFSLPLPAYSPALKSVVAMCSKLSPTVWSLAANSGRTKLKTVDVVHLVQNSPLLCYLLNSTDSTDSVYYLYKCHCEVTRLS